MFVRILVLHELLKYSNNSNGNDCDDNNCDNDNGSNNRRGNDDYRCR